MPCVLAAVIVTASGAPSLVVITFSLLPVWPRSVGLGPLFAAQQCLDQASVDQRIVFRLRPQHIEK